jgi:Copper transport outer membrane protein, MctB
LFDFRYHALSLVAVFLALGIGIVLGVTIGDSLVSEADRSLRAGLRGDVVDARDDERRARDQVERRDDLIETVFPILAADRLGNERVAVVAVGSIPDEVQSDVRDAVEEAGGEIDSVSELDAPPDLDELGEAVGGRFAEAGSNSDRAEALGARLGRALVAGRPLTAKLEAALGDNFRGDYLGADAVVYWRVEPDDPPRAAEAFEEALIQSIVASDVPAVGIERSDAEPSHVDYFDDQGLSSVDSIDVAGGRLALVFALDGDGEGRFGFKDSADEPLPRD